MKNSLLINNILKDVNELILDMEVYYTLKNAKKKRLTKK